MCSWTGAGRGIAHAGAAAGFPMPVLRYVVSGDGTEGRGGLPRLSPLAPRDGARVSTEEAIRFAWSADRSATYYRIDIQDLRGASILRALVPAVQRTYALPGSIVATAGGAVRWRVWALDGGGKLGRRTPWRTVRTPSGVSP